MTGLAAGDQPAVTDGKTCKSCGERRPLAEFPGCQSCRDGHKGTCKACKATRQRVRRQDPAMREMARIQHRRWRAANPDKRREQNRRYQEAHPKRVWEAPPEATSKVCSRCGETKLLSEFTSGRCCVCKACTAARSRQRYATDPEYREREKERSRREHREHPDRLRRRIHRRRTADPDQFLQQQRRRKLLNQHGMTPERYETMLDAQGGGCAACGKKPNGRSLHIDHDHTHNWAHRKGQWSCPECWRGLLCDACNQAAGLLHDEPERAYALGDYLALARQRTPLTTT
jgi:hypothetical protein